MSSHVCHAGPGDIENENSLESSTIRDFSGLFEN